jgi:hypothetical protein
VTDPRPPIKTIDDVVVSAGPIGVALDEQTIANAQRKSSRKAEPSLTMYTKDKAAFVQVSDRLSDQLDDDSRDRIEMMVGFANDAVRAGDLATAAAELRSAQMSMDRFHKQLTSGEVPARIASSTEVLEAMGPDAMDPNATGGTLER